MSSQSRDSSTRSHDLHDHMTYICTRTRAPRSARTDSDIAGPATLHGFRILPEPRTLPFPDPSVYDSDSALVIMPVVAPFLLSL